MADQDQALPPWAVVEEDAPLPDWAKVEGSDESTPPVNLNVERPSVQSAPPSTDHAKPVGTPDFLHNTVLPVASGVFDTMTLGTGPSALNQIQKVENFVKEKFGKKGSDHDYRQVVDQSAEDHPVKHGFGSVVGDLGMNTTLATLTGGASLTPQAQALQSFLRRYNQENSRGKSGYDVINPALMDATATAAIPVLGDDALKFGKAAAKTLPNLFGSGTEVQAVTDAVQGVSDRFMSSDLKQKLADYLGRFANERAVKSVASGANLEKLVGPLKGVPKDVYEKRVVEASDYMRQPREELGGEPILKKFLSSDDIAERYGTVEKGVGEKYNNLLGELQSHEATTDKFPATQLATELDDEVERAFPYGSNKARRDFLHKEVNNIRDDPAQELGLQGIEGTKRGFQGRADYSQVQSDDKEALKWLASKLRERGEQQADNVVNDYAPELAGQFQTLKKDFGLAAAGADAGAAEAGRALKNRAFSPSDYVAPLITKGSNDTAMDKILNIATMGGHKLARERGSSTMSVGAKWLSDKLRGGDQEAIRETFGEKFVQDVLPVLSGVMVRGGALEEEIQNLAATNPEFAEALSKLSGG